METSSRQLGERIPGSRERYTCGSHQHAVGIFTFKATGWLRSPLECVARIDLLGLSVFRGQAYNATKGPCRVAKGQRTKKGSRMSVLAWNPLDESVSRR